MGRPLRAAAGGIVYHMLNRANARLPIFQKDGDYEAFERILKEALEHVPGMRLLTYCLMPNHWHLLVWPRADGELSDFGHWLTLTHTQRWHAHYRDVGAGHLYQGRFKSFPVEADEYFLTLSRYVERNPVRANLVARAEDWRWGGLWRRHSNVADWLSPWPVTPPRNWLTWVNKPLTEQELGGASERGPRPAVWWRAMDQANGGAPWPDEHPAPARAAEEGDEKRVLTPFLLPCG